MRPGGQVQIVIYSVLNDAGPFVTDNFKVDHDSDLVSSDFNALRQMSPSKILK